MSQNNFKAFLRSLVLRFSFNPLSRFHGLHLTSRCLRASIWGPLFVSHYQFDRHPSPTTCAASGLQHSSSDPTSYPPRPKQARSDNWQTSNSYSASESPIRSFNSTTTQDFIYIDSQHIPKLPTLQSQLRFSFEPPDVPWHEYPDSALSDPLDHLLYSRVTGATFFENDTRVPPLDPPIACTETTNLHLFGGSDFRWSRHKLMVKQNPTIS